MIKEDNEWKEMLSLIMNREIYVFNVSPWIHVQNNNKIYFHPLAS